MRNTVLIGLIIFVIIHLIGFVVSTIIHFKDGTYRQAALYGDGVRSARPLDVLFLDLVVWEIYVLLIAFDFLDVKFSNWVIKNTSFN